MWECAIYLLHGWKRISIAFASYSSNSNQISFSLFLSIFDEFWYCDFIVFKSFHEARNLQVLSSWWSLKFHFLSRGSHSRFVVSRRRNQRTTFTLFQWRVFYAKMLRLLVDCIASHFLLVTSFKSCISKVGSWNSVWVYISEQVLSCQRIFLPSDLQYSSCWKLYLILFLF